MTDKKFKYDGRSRPVDNKYRQRWDEIFGQREQEELKKSYEQSKRNKMDREDLEYLKELRNKL
jgi:hypothetical protein|tara:strand:- start:455 stop:643 length:189 start_codon:yes stop_codon:yes gene_type:complete